MKRDEKGKIIPSLKQRLGSWWLARKIKKGKVPKGRIPVQKAVDALGSFKGNFPMMIGLLSAVVTKRNGERIDLGLISVKKVTTAFRDYIVDALQNSTTYPMDVFKYHAMGTGSTAEDNTQTALVTEVESRATGSQIEGTSSNIFKTVATIDATATESIQEHGIFSASADGTMMDRSVFSAINVDNGDSIEFTYEITFNAEA